MEINKKLRSYLQVTTITSLFFLFSIIVWLRFNYVATPCLWGDDLTAYITLYHNHFFNSLLDQWIFFITAFANFNEVRIIYNILYYYECLFFQTNMTAYFIFNVLVHAANGVLFFIAAYYFCKNYLISILLSIIAITVRFGLYQVTQGFGIVESIALFFCLLLLLILIREDSLSRKNIESGAWKWQALLCAFFALNTHERYIVLLPWLALFVIMHPRTGTIYQRVDFAIGCFGVLISNFFLKHLICNTSFFMGTGGAPIRINIQSIAKLSLEALLSIFSINWGPEYLAGTSWIYFPMTVQVASIGFAIICIYFIIIAILKQKPLWPIRAVNWPVCLLGLIGVLLLPPVCTVRMEQRWELAPFLAMLLIVARGIGCFPVKGWCLKSALCAILVFSITIEVYLSQRVESVFFVYEQEAANSVKHAVIDMLSSKPGAPLIFVGYPGSYKWAFRNGDMFTVYEGKSRNITKVSKMGDALVDQYPAETKMYAVEPHGKCTDITDRWRKKQNFKQSVN